MKHLHNLIRMIAIIGTLASLSTTTFAQTYYKCKGASGSTVYTSTPAPNQQCTHVQLSGISPSSVTANSIVSKPAPASKEPEPLASATIKKDPIPKASENEGNAAKMAQDTLKSGQRVYETDATGQRDYMDDASREKRLAQVQNMLNTRCAK